MKKFLQIAGSVLLSGFCFQAHAFEVVDMGTITVHQYANTTYASTLYEFNQEEVIKALGCTELSPEMVISIQNNNIISDFTANSGFWYDNLGQVHEYVGASFFIEYYGYDPEYPEDAYSFYVGNMPSLSEDLNISCNMGFEYNGKVALFNFDITILQEPIVVDTKFTDSLNFNKTFEGQATESEIPFDYWAVADNINAYPEDAKVISLDEKGDAIDQTANNGYWYNTKGEVCSYTDEDAAFYIEYRGDNEFFNIGFMGVDLENAKCNIGFYYAGKAYIFDITVNMEIAPITSVQVVKTYQEVVEMKVNEAFESTTLSINETEVVSALGCENLGQAMVISLASDGGVLGMTANNGYWYNAQGKVTTFYDDMEGFNGVPAWYIEYHYDGVWTIGNFDTSNVSGTSNIGFYYNGKAVMFEISVTFSDASGISKLENNISNVGGVYNLQGVKMGDNINNLPKGIYIVNGKKVLIP